MYITTVIYQLNLVPTESNKKDKGFYDVLKNIAGFKSKE